MIKITVTDRHEAIRTHEQYDFVVCLFDVGFFNEHQVNNFYDNRISHGTMCVTFCDDDSRVTKYSPTKDQVYSLLNTIHQAYMNGYTNFLIHCHAGVSRSTAIAICALIMIDKMSIEDAFAHILNIRPQMWPNSEILRHADDILGLQGKLVEYDIHWKADSTQ